MGGGCLGDRGGDPRHVVRDEAPPDGEAEGLEPFLQAISAIHGRPAYREVDRRLVYIDPHSRTDKPEPRVSVPTTPVPPKPRCTA